MLRGMNERTGSVHNAYRLVDDSLAADCRSGGVANTLRLTPTDEPVDCARCIQMEERRAKSRPVWDKGLINRAFGIR